ncbi:hypothetical protein BCR33DRAFT_853028 [Rhizoclosmatium globosum]|uniref:DDE Tnp4 domain-containing protein n=1 Tax=Rhizoclosmatium globosum TaxID=329046 RepID=A0A1Y2BYP1_9FUNG|nr:hypothetical protein BCR33DRAFT_853028 [Rhizoclosmatium globosum]|eukprot:ORY39888.1 hypothetical protein BCR33DRAFT_853028 [Rhizoclosmatium globosum]
MPRPPWSFVIGCMRASTGLDVETMERIYIKYCGRGTVIKTRKYLFDVMQSIKTNTTKRATAEYLGLKSYGYAAAKVKAGVMYLGQVINELEAAWDARWDDENDITDGSFDVRFRLNLDAFPVYIQRPQRNQKGFYSGKYKRHCVKVQCLTDNRGNICWMGKKMFKGAVHDMTMYVKDHPTISPGERVLADKGYVGLRGRQLGLIVPFKRRANQPALTPFL